LTAAYEYIPEGTRDTGIRVFAADLRRKTGELIQELYPEESAVFVRSILCGDRDGLDREVYAEYRDLGIAHILAVSGMHVAALGGALLLVFGLFLRRAHARLAASAVLLLYGVLTGFPISCVRAVLFFVFVSLGTAFRRTTDRLTAITFLAALITARSPTVWLQTGFILSFACAYAIWFLQEGRVAVWRLLRSGKKSDSGTEGRESPGRIRKALRYSVFLQLLLLPLQAALFFRVSPPSAIVNAVVIPLFGTAFVFMASGVLLGAVWIPLGRFVSGTAHWVLVTVKLTARFLREVPGTVLVTGRPGWIQYMAYVLLCVLVGYLALRRRRGACLLAAFGFVCFLPIRSGDMRIANLSVGQGDCSVIQKGGTCLVIDCGSTSRKGVGRAVLKPYLEYHGCAKPDAVWITHTDADHVNGIGELLTDEWRDVPVYCPPQETESEFCQTLRAAGCSNIRALSAGQRLTISCGPGQGKITVTALWPDDGPAFAAEEQTDRNRNGLVLHVADQYAEAVFAADADAEVLLSVLERYGELVRGCDYLKVAHHGSAHSLCPQWYAALSARVAVISVGRNTYGHPSKSVVEALESEGSEVYITRERGQVTTVASRRGCVTACFSDDREIAFAFSKE